MQLAPQEVEEYWHRGWTIVEGVFAPADVNAIGQLATTLCEQELASAVSIATADRTDQGQVLPRKLDFPFLKHPEFRTFALNARLRSLVEQLLGKPPMLVTDQLFMKPPRFGSAKPYHQDNAYFRCHPADQMLTAWIALDDVDQSNGCLRYIDESHCGPILDHLPVPGEPHNKAPATEHIDVNRESLACVKQGGVVFHHSKTLHTSHRNNSTNWRRAYATHWASADVTSDIDTIEKAYYHRSADIYEQSLLASAQLEDRE